MPKVPGWATRNGWEALRRRAGGKLPYYLPHTLTVDVSIPASANFQTDATATGRAIVESDARLLVLAATVNGIQTAAPADPQLGSNADESPDHWPATVFVTTESGGVPLSAGPVRAGAMFGGGEGRPYWWPCPWILEPGSIVRIDVRKRWTAAERAWFSFIGIKVMRTEPLPPWEWLLEPRLLHALRQLRPGPSHIRPFWFPLNFDEETGRAPFELESRTFTVSESPFLVAHLMGHVDDPADGTAWNMERPFLDATYAAIAAAAGPGRGTAAELVRLALEVGATRMDDRPITIGSLFGTGRRPGRFSYPLVMQPGQSLSALLQFVDASTAAGVALRAFLTFGGAVVLDGPEPVGIR